jgi:hypothetical protein
VADGWDAIEVGAVVALTANLVNLLDRAPGRAGKVVLAAAVAPALWGPADWTVAAAGLLGAAVAVLGPDLRERAMLGDAGANPLGAVVGLGLATSMQTPGRLVVIAVLLALNAVSERWSFSRAIERTPFLAALDRLGRRPPDGEREESKR